MNLANLGKAGLLVSQNRLQTAGHNINNAATPGYSRQRVLVQTAGATPTSAGWVGRGVQAVSVQRAYDDFLYRQLADARMKGAALDMYGAQISQINNLVADRTVGISPALQNFFDGIQAVATAPADMAARQELVGRANSLVTQIRDANAFFDNQRDNLNTQIGTAVSQVNSYLDQIQSLNRQIASASASTPGQPPNDLLNQRDQLVMDLGDLVDIRVYAQGNQIDIAVGNGQLVLSGGDTVHHLQALASDADPGRLAIYVTVPGGDGDAMAVEMDDSLIQGGKLGGLLAFRTDALDAAQNDLGRLAIGLADAINEQHAKGYDLSGEAGGAFFNITSAPGIIAAGGNDSAAVPVASFNDIAKLTNADYRIEFDGSTYVVTRLPEGSPVAPEQLGDTLSFDGVTLDVGGMSPTAGDHWLLQPVRNAAASLSMAVTDPAGIAAAGEDGAGGAAGTANGDNALALADLQTRKILGGSTTGALGAGAMSLNEAYAQLVNSVAVKTQQNTAAATAQDALIQQNYAAQQAVSGVNLDEEYINLMQYQEQYRASARLIDTASTLFDTLLGLRN